MFQEGGTAATRVDSRYEVQESAWPVAASTDCSASSCVVVGSKINSCRSPFAVTATPVPERPSGIFVRFRRSSWIRGLGRGSFGAGDQFVARSGRIADNARLVGADNR